MNGISGNSTCLTIYDQRLADFISKAKDKKQNLKRWVKDYLENEYPRLSFTVRRENEGDPISATEAIKEYCELSDFPISWHWIVHIVKDKSGAWNIEDMAH